MVLPEFGGPIDRDGAIEVSTVSSSGRHGMAAHGRGSVRSVSEGRRADERHVDVPGEVAAHGYFGPFDAIDAGIATGAAACDCDFQTGDEPQVHQVFGDRMIEFQVVHDGALAYLQIGKRAARRRAALLAAEYEVENHFQFQLYSNPFPETDNVEYHTCL